MTKQYNEIKIISDGMKTKVFLDGVEMKSLCSVSFRHDSHGLADIDLGIVIVPTQKKNTTDENSDVKCYGTSDNPMTKCEWENHKITSVSTSNKNQKI